jgi:hypothetical protein
LHPVSRQHAGHTHAGRGFAVATQPGECALNANVPPQRSHLRRAPYRPVSSPTCRRLRAEADGDHKFLEPREVLLVIGQLGREVRAPDPTSERVDTARAFDIEAASQARYVRPAHRQRNHGLGPLALEAERALGRGVPDAAPERTAPIVEEAMA